MDKELYTPEEAYEMTMKDIKAIYDDAAVYRMRTWSATYTMPSLPSTI